MMDCAVAAQMNGFALASWPCVKALILLARPVTLRNETRLIARRLIRPNQCSSWFGQNE